MTTVYVVMSLFTDTHAASVWTTREAAEARRDELAATDNLTHSRGAGWHMHTLIETELDAAPSP